VRDSNDSLVYKLGGGSVEEAELLTAASVLVFRRGTIPAVVPGLLAAAAIAYAIRQAPRRRSASGNRFAFASVPRGQLGRLMAAVAAFELGHVAATLLILRATRLLTRLTAPARPPRSPALGLYAAYNVAATVISIPAGRASDCLGSRGVVRLSRGGQ
jgi:hypothetical protein